MTESERDRFLESQQENFDADLIGHLVLNNLAMSDFICWMDDKYSKVIEKLLEEWLKTKDGQTWYDKTLDFLTEEPERPDEDYDR